jgi:serine/threonine protein kinase
MGGKYMPNIDSTRYDPGVTVPEGGETVYESGATMLDAALSDATAQAKSAAMENIAIQKGVTLLGTYRVESDAIEGGMGSVWRVHHTGWNVDLAMKRPQPKCFSTEKSKADFIHECEAWINLGLHPNIVSCYYVREIGGTPTIFSEWMDGGSLENAIEKETLYEGTPAEQQARILDIAVQFARGLHYAHEAGLIHQDVKPDNLLLNKEGDAKVADFGLAKARAALASQQSDSISSDGCDSGRTILSPSGGYTPAYCSMEQMDGRELTRRTDIYSWAVSVMEMYLGARPWANGVVAGMNCKGYFEQSRVPMSKPMQGLLAKCLSSELDARPHDFSEVEAVLYEIYRAETGADYPRPAPKAAADTADSLNNRALSMLDLGKPEEAEVIFVQALQKDAGNPESLYNSAMLGWCNGKTDDALALRMVNVISDESKRNAYISQMKETIGVGAACQMHSTIIYRWISNTIYDASGARVYYLASLEGNDGKIRYSLQELTDCGSYTLLHSEHGEPQRITMSVDEKWICLTYQQEILLYGTENQRKIKLERDRETASACAAKDGDGVYLGKTDGLYYYDFCLKKAQRIFASSNLCRTLTQSHDGRMLAWRSEADGGCTVSVLDTNTQELLISIKSDTEPWHLGFSYGDRYLCVGHDNGDFWVCEIATGKKRLHIATGREFKSICALPGGRYIATGQTGYVRIWDIQLGICRGTCYIPDQESTYLYPIYKEDETPRIGILTRNCNQYVLDLPGKELSPVWQISVVTSATEQLSRDEHFLGTISAAESAYRNADYRAALEKLKEARSISGYSLDTRCLNLYKKLTGHFRLSGEPKLILLQRLPKMSGASLSADGRYFLCEHEASVYSSQSGECLISSTVLSKYKGIAFISGDRVVGVYLAGERYDLMADVYELPSGKCVKSGLVCKGSGPSDVCLEIYSWPDCRYFLVYFPSFYTVRNVVVDGVTCKATGNFQFIWAFNNEVEQLPDTGLVGPHEIRDMKTRKRVVKFKKIRDIDWRISRRLRYVMTADPKTMLVGAITQHFGFYDLSPKKQRELDFYDGYLFLYAVKTGELLRIDRKSVV